MSLIDIKNLTFSYKTEPVLSSLSLTVCNGEFWIVAGPNGSGKTTLMKIISRIIRAYSGQIKISGKDLKNYTTHDLSKHLATVRQEYIPAFGYSVFETVMMARTLHFGWLGFESKQDRQIVEKSLEMTNTIQFADRLLSEISGGERQRVFIARALAQKSNILLLDEPTSNLDMKHQVAIYDLLKKLQNEQNITIMMVVHDINLARQYCDKVLLVGQDSKYLTGKPDDVLNEDNIGRYYEVSGCFTETQGTKFFIPRGCKRL